MNNLSFFAVPWLRETKVSYLKDVRFINIYTLNLNKLPTTVNQIKNNFVVILQKLKSVNPVVLLNEL